MYVVCVVLMMTVFVVEKMVEVVVAVVVRRLRRLVKHLGLLYHMHTGPDNSIHDQCHAHENCK